jgi:peroxiredoxin Q/BCP
MDNQNQLCNFDIITLKQNNMTTLKIGDKAPSFESVDEKGNAVKLSDYAGKKLVLFFYPKASTPGCTAEACDLRDNYKTFLAKGYDVLGVSADSAKRQQNFINKNELPFPLLADESKDVINAFGVWGPKKFMGREYDGIHRTTFVIDENGVIEDVITKVKTKEHANQILK